MVGRVVAEVEQLPAASKKFAEGVGWVVTPEHLVPLRTRVRECHWPDVLAVHVALNERWNTTGASDDFLNVFYAASEMAVMAEVGRDELPDEDVALLRDLWTALLTAN